MRKLISLLIMAVIAVMIYNYFLGTEAEKEEVKEIVGEAKQVGGAIKNLIKSEKEKYDEGKYDKVISRLKALEGTGKKVVSDYSDRLDEIERKKSELNEMVGSDTDEALSPKEQRMKEDLDNEILDLLKEMESGN